MDIPEIKVQDPENTWVALDLLDYSVVVAEGRSPAEVEERSKNYGKQTILAFVPRKGITYIF
jgi:hypothetical protein